MALSLVLIGLSAFCIILLLVLVLRRDWGDALKSEIVRLDEKLQNLNAILSKTEQAVREEAKSNREEIAQSLKNLSESSSKQIIDLTRLNEQKLENIRKSVEDNLKSIQEDNSKKLEQMRETVDEKLQSTLEKRLGESFTQVSQRLQSVYEGLGEMKKLASEVGNLKNVLTRVKTRGTTGEIWLENILEQIMPPEHYLKNAKINGKEVEFAIKLPGKGQGEILLPVDSKFNLEIYQKLIEAQEQADPDLVKEYEKGLENAIKLQARDIKDKYILPPRTTDFAIMFLPVEGLFAEVLRRPGLFEALQSQYKVTVTGPTTLAAFLNSLQMGFRTLAIEKRATEVWKILAAVKSDMDKFMESLEKVRDHLDKASNKIDEAANRTRIIGRKLKDVQALPAPETERLLEAGEDSEETPET